jgi:long-chain acyl-CoA synthetase
VITGRTHQAIVLGSGERVEPEPIEQVLQESPYVREAVVVGDRRDSVGLLIVPDMDSLRGLARTRRISYGDEAELIRNPAVSRFYQAEVQSRLLARGIAFPGGKGVRLALIPTGFEVGRELTRTLSKKREVIAELYGSLIERLYRS